ncbi:hypothetical protein LINPERHAP2_LOCUS16341 [Linum perenne]
MDLATTNGARGRFARVCVEIDITKPLLGKYMIEDKILKIEYESLENLCFDCGIYGHKKEACPLKVVTQDVNMVGTRNSMTEDCTEENEVGEWMTVQRRNRRRATKPAQPSKKIVSSKQGFTILQDAVPEPEVEMQVKDKGAAVASSSHNKSFKEIAESLSRVLDGAAEVQVNEDSLRRQSPATTQRQILKNITNSHHVPAAEKNARPVVLMFELGQENNERPSSL